jgi:uncharacterized repeat protein (TIGR03803 family)
MRAAKLFPLRSTLALLIVGCSFAAGTHGQTVTNLAVFNGSDGNYPMGPLTQATDGNFYGMTQYGGAYSAGNVFQLTPDGKLSNLYSFCSQANCADGWDPQYGPILGADGDLYGATFLGGVGDGGTIYKLTLGGKLTTLYTFCTVSCEGGAAPNGIIQGSNGNFYGTTRGGGHFGWGTIFEISSTGEFTLLYTFCSLKGCADGREPEFPLIQASDGNFYGATPFGGSTGTGVFYEITPAGAYQVLYNFDAQPNTIIENASGNFVGTTQGSGLLYGVVFEITANNQYSVLHTFDGTDGAYPVGGLTLANDGNFYGMTYGGGATDLGTIFLITQTGELRSLHNFCDPRCNTGQGPVSSFFQGTDGTLYGTTTCGWHACLGNVFTLTNNLSPLVETVPTMGKAGTHVLILGNNLTGSTSVAFNGEAAVFTVNSDTYITAIVPKRAATGTVQVVTPTGTLSGNPQFVVTK